jgi:hypothetical protein
MYVTVDNIINVNNTLQLPKNVIGGRQVELS